MDIIVLGALGRMGKLLCDLTKKEEDMRVVAVVDNRFEERETEYMGCKAYRQLEDVCEKADVLVNFASHALAKEVAKFAKKNKVALCELCTGHTAKERDAILRLSRRVPVFFASNTSLGVAYVLDMSKKLAKTFPFADVEIVERHHSLKQDVPSGTALSIANAVKEARNFGNVCIGRHKDGARDVGEICIHSIRQGDFVGEHTLLFDMGCEQIEIRHVACSRELYALGAIRAIRYVAFKGEGCYGMQDLT